MIAICLLAARPAYATYSICAVDTVSHDVGGAGTSCVGSFSVANIYGGVPEHGVMHAQAQFNARARDRAVARLGADVAPDAILAELLAPSFDPDATTRQYAILDVRGMSARYTGADTSAYADDRGGTAGDFVYAVQGNILTSGGVLDRAALAFEDQNGAACDLAERLMRALEAGAEMGEGDSRCTPNGIPSDGAFIEVDRPGEPAGSYLKLHVDDTAPENPLVLLRQQFEQWRPAHPCPVVQVDAGAPPDAEPAIDGGAPANDAATDDAAIAPAVRREDGCGCTEASKDVPALELLVLVLASLAASQAVKHADTSRNRERLREVQHR